MHNLKTYIKQFQQGKFHLFDAFYEETSTYVFFTLKKYLRDSMLIEDLMQDVYIKFIQKINDIDIKQFSVSYLTTMARNKAIDYLRKQTFGVVIDDNFISQVIDVKEETKDYVWLLDTLEKEDTYIVYMHVIETLSFKELSVILEVPLGTVYSKYKKALKKLKETYIEHQKNA